MDAIDQLIALIKESEGCKLKAYKCPAGVWTCGWGNTGTDIKKGTMWTQDYADARLRTSALRALTAARCASPVLCSEIAGRQVAIADFIYNCGLGAYQKSTLKKRVDEKDWESTQIEIKRWNKGGGKVLLGLVARRAKEAELLV